MKTYEKPVIVLEEEIVFETVDSFPPIVPVDPC